MPCHDILVKTAITDASYEWIQKATPFWESEIANLGLTIPAGFYVTTQNNRASYDDVSSSLMISGISSLSAADQATVVERYQQSYVASQIFAALQADGYTMTATFSTDFEGAWIIEARDETRNATIGVTLFRDLQFEIDFLDALHDDSVWLSGGEFGRVLEYLRRLGLSVDIIKQDIDEESQRAIASNLYA
jgi:hypothetical protein